MMELFARRPVLPPRGCRQTPVWLDYLPLKWFTLAPEQSQGVPPPSHPDHTSCWWSRLEEEADKLWARMKRSLWQEGPVLQKRTKGDYNCSSHQNIFVSLLAGKSPKAFQNLQNEISHDPWAFFWAHLDSWSSSLTETNRRERNFWASGGRTHLKVNYVQSEIT